MRLTIVNQYKTYVHNKQVPYISTIIKDNM